MDERRQIRQAALEHGSIPSYNGLTAEEKEKWKGYVARVSDKPAEEVTVADWDKVTDGR